MTEPADYRAVNEVITINPGQEGQHLCEDIGIVNDDLIEGTESFTVSFESVGPGTMILTPQLMATIQDDDGIFKLAHVHYHA